MFKRILYLSNPAYIKIKGGLIIIEMQNTGEIFSAPPNDVAMLIMDNPQITITQSIIEICSKDNIQLISCDNTHHPVASLQNFASNNIQTKTVLEQINATEPMKKNMWMQTVKAKIKNQSVMLKSLNKDYLYLDRLYTQVKSGDTTNREAIAAKHYWKELFCNNFKRERYGEPPNNLLNFVYMVLRAAVARSVVSSGLLPILGYHHHNQYNAYCLADDVIEPYRVFADEIVLELLNSGNDEINKESKKEMLQIIYRKCKIKGKEQPIINALRYTSASVASYYGKKTNKLIFPSYER